jgi:ankyrin repeat protein
MYEKKEAVAFLLGAGAVPDKENSNGVTPLMAAARDGYSDIVKQLLVAGADVTQVDEFGRTVRHRMCTSRQRSCCHRVLC